jgi:putative ABC transport system permease protein
MFYNYLTIALRNFRKRPGYTLINSVGLALGMAGGIVLFLFIHFHWQTDRHHAQAGQIYRVVLDLHLENGSVEHESGVSLPMVEALQKDFSSVERATFLKEMVSPTITVLPAAGKPVKRFLEEGTVAFANPDYFQIFSCQWLAGSPAKALTEPGTVVLTRRYALKYFGNENITGKLITINNTDFRITGVLGDFPPTTDLKKEVFVSLRSVKQMDPDFNQDDFTWTSSRHQLFVRLDKAASAAGLQAQLPAFSAKYLGAEAAKAYNFRLQPLRDVHFDTRYGGSISYSLLGMLALIGLFLVSIACMNFINLATVQAFLRAKEIGVRQVLGSTPGQVFRQFMVETALVVLASGLVAAWLALLVLPLLNQWLGTAIQLNPATVALYAIFWFVLVVGVTLAAGSYPALVLSRLRPVVTLKAGRFAGSTKSISLRKVLVVVQFSIGLGLMISTIVVTRQLCLFEKTDMGFDQTAIVNVQLPKTTESQRHTLRNQLAQLPGVQQVTFQFRPPASDSRVGGSVRFDNRSKWEEFPIRDRWGDAHYLDTYGLKLVAGRNFTERDSLPEVVVNETFVRKLGLQHPEQVLSRAIEDGTRGTQGTIVGVVKDFHHQSLHQPVEACAIFYFPEGFAQAGIKLETKDLSRSITQLERQWRQSFPDAIFSYQFVDEQIARFYGKEQLIGRLTNLFSGLAIFVACLGLFGLAAFTARQRTKEIGIRKIAGATVSSIVALLAKDFLKLVLIAFLIAAPVAGFLMNQWLQDFACRVDLTWWVFALSGLMALFIAVLTVSFQAIRAALANPARSLRNE